MSRRTDPPPASGIAALVRDRLFGPVPIERLELARILLPLVILGFMSSRLVHADHWIGDAGFMVPDLGGDWRQPLYLPPLPATLAWFVAAAMIVSGLATSFGLFVRFSGLVFAATLIWVALADRLAAFTVTKLSPVLVLTLVFGGAGARYSLDAWRAHQRESARSPRAAPPAPPPTHISGGGLRFLRLFLVTFYCASGICKADGDWLARPDVLWTHLHDSYQTGLSHLAANLMPRWSWTVFQFVTLAFEILAPLWFFVRATRPFALAWGVAMHIGIGLFFGPVIWFSLLMIVLLLVAWLPDRLLIGAFARVGRLTSPRARAAPPD